MPGKCVRWALASRDLQSEEGAARPVLCPLPSVQDSGTGTWWGWKGLTGEILKLSLERQVDISQEEVGEREES